MNFINQLILCISYIATATVPNPPLTRPSQKLQETFKKAMRFSFSAGCNSTWIESKFPIGSQWDEENPTIILKSAYNESSTTAGFVAVNHKNKEVIVTFRGSATKTSWMLDFKFLYTHANLFPVTPAVFNGLRNAPTQALVHSGFQKAYMDLRDTLHDPILHAAEKYPDYHLLFTGHSLGAALAEFAAVDIATTKISLVNRISLINFASPRIGNQPWATFVDSLGYRQSMRIVKFGDYVPHLPPRFISYRHSFKQYSILEDNSFELCSNYEADGSDCIYDDKWTIMTDRQDFHADFKYLGYLNATFDCMGYKS